MPEDSREHNPEASSAMPDQGPTGTRVESEAKAHAPELVLSKLDGASPPAQPANKLHEWGAAILIMLILSAILAFFVTFLRGTSL